MPRQSKADDAEVLQRALKNFALACDAENDQRKRELDDLRFEKDPWPEAAKVARAGYMYAGVNVPARPMLNIPMLGQPIQLVLNQEKAAHLGITVHPETEEADDDTAEIDQGIIRHIETRSRANLARSWAFERAIRCGRGYYEIRKRYARANATGPAAFDQELYIARILNQFSVYDDPWATEPDASDRQFLFKIEDLPTSRYNRTYSDSTLASMDTKDAQSIADGVNEGTTFTSIGDAPPQWATDEYRRVAEYWEVETKTEEVRERDKTREKVIRKVIWRKINGVEILDEEEWDGLYIPVVLVIGRELNIGGKRIWDGLVGPAKDSVRLVNFAASGIAEKIAIDTKAPYMLAEGQEEGHEQEFVRSSVQPTPYLRYKPVTVNGELAPPPQRNIAGPDLSADIALLQQSKEFVHGATATFDPSLGNVSPKDRSGKAIVAQQQQSDSSNSDFLDNLGEISMTYEAKVLLDLIPKVYDRPGRLQEIINGKDERRKIIIGQPFFEHQETGNPVPVLAGQNGGPPMMQGPQGPMPAPPNVKIEHYDLSKGEYGVTVSVGKSYQTRMQQGLDTLGQLIQAEPNLLPILGWRWMQYNDSIPGHDEIAEDLKKIRPPQLQTDEEGSQQQMQAQFKQLADQHSLLVKELNAKNQIIETDQIKRQTEIDKAKIDQQTKIETAKADRDAKIIVAAINAKMQDSKVLMEVEASANELLMTHAHEGLQSHLDRQHDAAMAGADAGHEAAMGDQAHQQALEQGAQGHEQALEQGQQAADLAPAPAPANE